MPALLQSAHCFLQLNYSAPQPTSTHRCNSHANCFFHLHNALIAPSWHLMLCDSLRRSPAASISVSFGPSASALNDHSTALPDSFHWSTRPRSDSRCLPIARLLQALRAFCIRHAQNALRAWRLLCAGPWACNVALCFSLLLHHLAHAQSPSSKPLDLPLLAFASALHSITHLLQSQHSIPCDPNLGISGPCPCTASSAVLLVPAEFIHLH